jgi:uncharacterized protein DUF1097
MAQAMGGYHGRIFSNDLKGASGMANDIKISPAPPESMLSGVVQYNVQTLIAASIAASCAGISAALGCPAWAMFLGWVAALVTDHSFKEICNSYVCLLIGIAIGAVGTVLVGDLRPSMGPFADALVILGMASIIASMRRMPRFHYLPSYILGVIGMFAIHADRLGLGVIKVVAPSALGASGIWFATRLQMRIAKKSAGSDRRSE